MKKLIHIAPSRSGHNYIRHNLSSWMGELNRYDDYIGLESQDPSNYDNIITPPVIDQEKYHIRFKSHDYNEFMLDNSIYNIVSNRDLLNWLASSMKMRFNVDYDQDASVNLLGVFTLEEVLQKPKEVQHLYLKHHYPNISIIDEPKEDYYIRLSKNFFDKQKIYETKVENWKKITDELVGNTNYIPNSIPIFYDRFTQDASYRQEICLQVDGSYNETFLLYVGDEGRGSSFDGVTFDGEADLMDTNNRYKFFVDHADSRLRDMFLNILRSCPEAVSLYQTHWTLDASKSYILSLL